MTEPPRKWTERERKLREYNNELRFLRKRIARLKDELERAYKHERYLVNVIADAEGED